MTLQVTEQNRERIASIVGVALFQVLTKKDLPLLHRHLRPVPHPDASSEPMPYGHVDQG